jgi:exopolysaccharide production protein ExoZ
VLPLLEVLRGLAALSVAFVHVTQETGAFVGRPGAPAYDWLRPLPWDAGVHVFFVISGFVMVWSSRPLFAQPGARWLFAGRRLARVVPLYWLTTAVLLATRLALPGSSKEGLPSAAYVVASLLFVPWQHGGEWVPVYSLGWTLNYEMLFYGIFAVFVTFPARVAVPSVIGVVAAIACAGQIVDAAWMPLPFGANAMVLEFAFGATLAVVATRVHLPAPWRAALVLAGCAGLVAADRSTGLPIGISFGLPCTALVAAAVLGPPAPATSVSMRAGVSLGAASYALYLTHPFPMRALSLLWPRVGLSGVPSVLGYVAITIAACVVMAFAVHRWVERPMTSAARRWLRTGTPSPPGRGQGEGVETRRKRGRAGADPHPNPLPEGEGLGGG